MSQVGAGAFAGATPLTFDGVALGTDVNGFSTGGYTFGWSGGNGQVLVSNGGPGNTNSLTEPFALSATSTGTLSVAFASPWHAFGFGFADLSIDVLADAVSITLFSGLNNLGTIAIGGAPDPEFTGGFAGVSSVAAFDRAELVFAGGAFAMDNLVTADSTVPEPASMMLLATGLLGMAAARRRKKTGA